MIYFKESSRLTALPQLANPSLKLMNFILTISRKHKIENILDFGSGNGRHSKFLRNKGFSVYSYDPYLGNEKEDPLKSISNKKPEKEESYDLVFTSFVLNVVDKKECESILKLTEEYSKKFVLHIVREDLRRLNGSYKITRKGTFQRDVQKHELIEKGYKRKNGIFIKEK